MEGLPIIKAAGAYESERRIIVTKSIGNDELDMWGAKPDFDTTGGRIFECTLCGTEKDRHDDRFTVPVLEKFAKDVNGQGVPLYYNHSSDLFIGRAFAAKVVPMGMESHLVGLIWVNDAANIPAQQGIKIANEIEAKRLKDVSVGFRGQIRAGKRNQMGDVTEWEWYVSEDAGEYATELRELSVVPKGAQPAARFKSLDKPTEKESQNWNMSHTKSIKIGGKDVEIKAVQNGDSISIDTAALENEIKAIEAERDTKAAAEKTASDQVTALKAEIAKYREPLENAVLNHEERTVKGAAKLTEAQVKAMPIEQLIAKAAEAEKALGGKEQPESKTQYKLDFK